MEVVSQLNRRKACDLCFVKKIKCDMLKPVCSNCKLYKAVCKTTAVRRRIKHRAAGSRTPGPTPGPAPVAPPAVSPPSAPSAPEPGTGEIDSVESRLFRIEEQLQQVLAVATAALNANLPGSNSTSHSARPASTGIPSMGRNAQGTASLSPHVSLSSAPLDSSSSAGPDGDAVDLVKEDVFPKLPPLETILPVIEGFFTHVNSHVPLFSQTEFMRMLREYYATTYHSPRPAWAAVNVVLALARRMPDKPSNHLHLMEEDSVVSQYISNVQSVLPELVTRQHDLLGLQVLLGLVILFNCTRDQQPATVLIGTAMRLAHRMHLHDREYLTQFTEAEILQRSRLFWISYSLDKEISLQHQTPPIQVDEDVDLDFPLEDPPDGLGNIYLNDGRSSISYLLLRVQLAHIQGQVYQLLFSTRATRISLPERQARVIQLGTALEKWRAGVPPELQLGVIKEHVGRTALFWMVALYFRYLACLVMVNGIWSRDASWRQRISTYSSVALIDAAAPSCYSLLPPLPQGWKDCVQVSRDCLSLNRQMPLSDCCLWTNGCALYSGLVILLTNIHDFPKHENARSDMDLAQYSLDLYERLSDASNWEYLKQLHIVAADLGRLTRLIMESTEAENEATQVQPRHQGGSSEVESDESAADYDGDLEESHDERHEAGDANVQWTWDETNSLDLPAILSSLGTAQDALAFSIYGSGAGVAGSSLDGWTSFQPN